MDVRIGITQVARELLVELADDTDRESLRNSISAAIGGAVDTLTLTDRRGRDILVPAEKIAYVDFKDTAMLRKFVSDRGKIRARRVTGNCAQHQRDVAAAVKNAREMALLPYSAR